MSRVGSFLGGLFVGTAAYAWLSLEINEKAFETQQQLQGVRAVLFDEEEKNIASHVSPGENFKKEIGTNFKRKWNNLLDKTAGKINSTFSKE
eukprot:maker-scaffold_29-snap-gene-1.0-mRNA-1 protein AED:0.00 eAED:0.00 QI:88/1/1/1/1/1/2/83/91